MQGKITRRTGTKAMRTAAATAHASPGAALAGLAAAHHRLTGCHDLALAQGAIAAAPALVAAPVLALAADAGRACPLCQARLLLLARALATTAAASAVAVVVHFQAAVTQAVRCWVVVAVALAAEVWASLNAAATRPLHQWLLPEASAALTLRPLERPQSLSVAVLPHMHRLSLLRMRKLPASLTVVTRMMALL